jgi:hypothetical protein
LELGRSFVVLALVLELDRSIAPLLDVVRLADCHLARPLPLCEAARLPCHDAFVRRSGASSSAKA